MGEVERDTEDFGCRLMPITNTSHYQFNGDEEVNEEIHRAFDSHNGKVSEEKSG